MAPTPLLISHTCPDSSCFQVLPFLVRGPFFSASFINIHSQTKPLDFLLQSPRSAFTCICTPLSTGLPLDVFYRERDVFTRQTTNW